MILEILRVILTLVIVAMIIIVHFTEKLQARIYKIATLTLMLVLSILNFVSVSIGEAHIYHLFLGVGWLGLICLYVFFWKKAFKKR
jgi:hypothetical protein